MRPAAGRVTLPGMATYTIQTILGHETGVQIGDRTFDAYTIQLAEDQRPVRLLRTPNNPPSLGPVQGDIIEGDRGPRFKIAYGQQQTAQQQSSGATYEHGTAPAGQFGVVATSTPVYQQQQPSVDWAEKDRRIGRQAAVKAAVWAYPLVYGQPEFGRTVTPPMVAEFLERLRPMIDWFEADSAAKHEPVQAEPTQATANSANNDDDSVPF